MSMQPNLSVIICTHNPRRDYLDQVLAALKSQTLPLEQWELLLIDNASERLLSSELDLNWHPNAHHIREEQLGLTPARLRGIRESKNETIVFVDDDNVLDSDYLEVALQISKDCPFLGAWGGQIRPDFEETPPDWTKRYWSFLAIRDFERDKWSNLSYINETTPCGAGMCVRKSVAEKYANLLQNDPRRVKLGRKGNLLISYEDSDLALTACDIGLGTGQFQALQLTHLIPSTRLQKEYFIRLCEGMAYSGKMLDFFRGKVPTPPSWRRKLFSYYQLLRMAPIDRQLSEAFQSGENRAIKEATITTNIKFG